MELVNILLATGRTPRCRLAPAGCAALLLCSLIGTLTAAPPAIPSAVGLNTRTRAEVEKLIADTGNTPPDWWDTTPLKYPPTLDLTWKQHPGGWQPRKNMGAYFWDIIDPNPGKWPEGVKLAQHTLSVNRGNADAQTKAMRCIAKMYAELMSDYPRGAFWARKAGGMEVTLADCYIKMGNNDMAVEVLRRIGKDNTRAGQVIKLWAEMGDLRTALGLAEGKATAGDPVIAFLAAGDACRRQNHTARAIQYYQKAIAAKGRARDDDANKKRATANLEATRLFDSLDLTKINDGAYKANSIAYVGPLEVQVTVKNHRIEKVEVTAHKEKQFYASLTEVPPRIIAKQSVKGIDTTTGATVTSEAIVNATAKALASAQGQ
ncbi:MAG: FMN-binding protein [Phycisphaeraceae bacterium]